MRRIGLRSAATTTELAQAGHRDQPMHKAVAGTAVAVLGVMAFTLGAYGTDVIIGNGAQPALAQVSAKPAVTLAAKTKPTVLASADDVPVSDEPLPELTDDSVASSSDADDIVVDEVLPDAKPRPPKPEKGSDSFDAGDDPWASLDGPADASPVDAATTDAASTDATASGDAPAGDTSGGDNNQ